MECLLRRNFYHSNTRLKFDLLNSMYTKMIENKSAQINFLEAIVNHASLPSSQIIIDQHRGLHLPFFHPTKTHAMFDDFKTQLSKQHSFINAETKNLA
jgi:hypothetical protein